MYSAAEIAANVNAQGYYFISSKIILDKRTSRTTEKTTVGRIRPAGLGLGTPESAGLLKGDMGHEIDECGKENTQN